MHATATRSFAAGNRRTRQRVAASRASLNDLLSSARNAGSVTSQSAKPPSNNRAAPIKLSPALPPLQLCASLPRDPALFSAVPRLPSFLHAPEPGDATLKTRPWGGTRLASLRAAPPEIPRPIGESWEFSTLVGSESRSAGRPLSALLGRQLPFLAKLLDTARPLSIQVHPNDDPATATSGKEEAWVVLDAAPDAFVLAGVKPGVTHAEFADAVYAAARDASHGPALLVLLQAVSVQKGTTVLVRAGTVHAIGGGILLAEIQQPADCTYRIFDYGSNREVHLADALHAARVQVQPTVWQPGEKPTVLRGKHIELEILGPGHHQQVSHTDALLISVSRHQFTAGNSSIAIDAGALHLITPGHRFEIEVPNGGVVVVGRLMPPQQN